MDNEKYLFKLQQEYLDNSKIYMNALAEDNGMIDIKELAITLRCLLTEIKAVKEEISRNKNSF